MGFLRPIASPTTSRAAALTLSIVVGLLVAGCGGSPPATPCPSPDGSIRLDDGTTLPVCQADSEVTAIGEAWNLLVMGSVADARRFGGDLGRVSLLVLGYTGPGSYTLGPTGREEGPATGSPGVVGSGSGFIIATWSSSVGMFGTRPSGPSWDGVCTLDVDPPGGRIAGVCEMRSGGQDPIVATIDLPAPELTPGWMEAEYEIGGSYAASGRLRLAVPSGDSIVIVIPLSDGSSLRIVPQGERPAFLDTVPADSPYIVDHRPTPENGMQPFDPSFGACAIELDRAWVGSVRCPGQAGHPNGSVTLELETRLP